MYTKNGLLYLLFHIRVIFLLGFITCLFSEYFLNNIFSSELSHDSISDSWQEQSTEESAPREQQQPELKRRKPMTEFEIAIWNAKSDIIRDINSALKNKSMTVEEAERLKEKVRSSKVTDVEEFKREMEREIRTTILYSKVPRHPLRNPYPGGFIILVLLYLMYLYFRQKYGKKKNIY